MEFQIKIDGAEKVKSLLRRLPLESPKIVRASAGKALQTMSAAMKSAIPSAITKGHSTVSVQRSIGVRIKSKSEVLVMAKTGVGVGQITEDNLQFTTSKRKKTAVNHAHLYVMGTQDRWTGERSWRIKGGKRRKKPTGNPRRFRGKMNPRVYMPRAMSEVINSNTASVSRKFVGEVERRVMERFNGV